MQKTQFRLELQLTLKLKAHLTHCCYTMVFLKFIEQIGGMVFVFDAVSVPRKKFYILLKVSLDTINFCPQSDILEFYPAHFLTSNIFKILRIA